MHTLSQSPSAKGRINSLMLLHVVYIILQKIIFTRRNVLNVLILRRTLKCGLWQLIIILWKVVNVLYFIIISSKILSPDKHRRFSEWIKPTCIGLKGYFTSHLNKLYTHSYVIFCNLEWLPFKLSWGSALELFFTFFLQYI